MRQLGILLEFLGVVLADDFLYHNFQPRDRDHYLSDRLSTNNYRDDDHLGISGGRFGFEDRPSRRVSSGPFTSHGLIADTGCGHDHGGRLNTPCNEYRSIGWGRREC